MVLKRPAISTLRTPRLVHIWCTSQGSRTATAGQCWTGKYFSVGGMQRPWLGRNTPEGGPANAWLRNGRSPAVSPARW